MSLFVDFLSLLQALSDKRFYVFLYYIITASQHLYCNLLLLRAAFFFSSSFFLLNSLCIYMEGGNGGSCSSMEKVMGNYGDQPHVLAVDDNLIDRKLVEKLLKNSSCKGNDSLFLCSQHTDGLEMAHNQ